MESSALSTGYVDNLHLRLSQRRGKNGQSDVFSRPISLPRNHDTRIIQLYIGRSRRGNNFLSSPSLESTIGYQRVVGRGDANIFQFGNLPRFPIGDVVLQ